MLVCTLQLQSALKKNRPTSLTAEPGDRDAAEQKPDPTCPVILLMTETAPEVQRPTIPAVPLDPQGLRFLSHQGSAPSASSEIIC